MIGDHPLEKVLIDVKQELFNEMVEGNGRQPAECVDMIIYALMRAWPHLQDPLTNALRFSPDYIPPGER